MSDENVKEILTCIIKHIRPDGEFYPFTKDDVEKMKECLNSETRETIKNCFTCKYFNKKKMLKQNYCCLKFMSIINDPYKETYSCYEEDLSQ